MRVLAGISGIMRNMSSEWEEEEEVVGWGGGREKARSQQHTKS
jgi:hypothetical protein